MSERPRDPDDLFAERLARVLGQPERFGSDFERSLTAAIQADRPIRLRLVPRARRFTRAWWRTPATVRLSPIAATALAAGLMSVAILGTRRIDRRSAVASTSVATTGAVHDTVTFV